MTGENPSSRDPVIRGDSHLASQNDGERRPNKGAKAMITCPPLQFHFPNDFVATVPKRFDRACLPPPGYLAIYKTNLRARLRFPPSPKLIDISAMCGVSLAQFSYRATSVTVGLIAFFGD
ncbi:hypothetical protein IEQ34_000650 [Dendrobium chrysotoxum]|uniref:Uncharacterized protein n=1 Tax=Dendrobium chrysotoxum TaxID=161865 RepID=A0AAV7HTJ6_DENCH|nr:hypothetical protein IEQ34_000650 [Dendrobium chrysotoxum]